MANNQVIFFEGVVLENLPNALFRIKLEDERAILCYLAGKMRRNWVRLLPGDKVRCELTPYDDSRGRIVAKLK